MIEDTRELQIQREHVVQMEARPPDAYGRGQVTIRDLFATSLRMRPDRIIIGEVRRGEALDLIQAMTSGHRGALATLHASSPYDACHRLETLAMMADVGIPLYALRRQVASAVDLLVQTDRLASGRRLISHVAELEIERAVAELRPARRLPPRPRRRGTGPGVDRPAAEVAGAGRTRRRGR